MLKVRLRDKFSWWKYCLPFKDLLWRVTRYQGNRYALPNAETGERCHLTGSNFGLVEFTRDLKSLHSCPNNGHSLGNEIKYSLCSFFAFLTLPKYNTPCPPFLGHFLLLGRGDHSSSVCVSTSSEKGGSACRCPQYC